MNTYHFKYSDESSLLKSPLISISSRTLLCMSFYYHMYGEASVLTGELSVNVYEPQASNNMLKVWSRAGKQGHEQNEWMMANLNLNISSDFRIIIKAQRFKNYFGDIGLDDITLENGECKNPDNRPSLI